MPDLQNLIGVHGEGFGLRSIVSDVSGVFGEGFGFSANSFLLVTTPLGLPVQNINFVLTWQGGQENIVGYDSAYLYLKDRPLDTPITVSFSGNGNYSPFTNTITIPAAEPFRRIDINLEFREAYARITKKRFL